MSEDLDAEWDLASSQSGESDCTATSYFTMASGDYFGVCTSQGFRIHSMADCSLKVDCNAIEGGLSLCQPYTNSDIFFVVGSGKNEALPTNKLCLWNDSDKKFLADIQLLNPIQDLKTSGDWVCVAEAEKLFVFNLSTEETLTEAIAEISVEIN